MHFNRDRGLQSGRWHLGRLHVSTLTVPLWSLPSPLLCLGCVGGVWFGGREGNPSGDGLGQHACLRCFHLSRCYAVGLCPCSGAGGKPSLGLGPSSFLQSAVPRLARVPRGPRRPPIQYHHELTDNGGVRPRWTSRWTCRWTSRWTGSQTATRPLRCMNRALCGKGG